MHDSLEKSELEQNLQDNVMQDHALGVIVGGAVISSSPNTVMSAMGFKPGNK
jgi:hypothetical protein